MPTFEIGLQDGRTLHIEATDQAAAISGVQHFLGNKPAEASGVIDSARQGVSDVLGGAGKTLHDYLGPGYVGDALTAGAKTVAPTDFKQAPIVDDGGFHPGNIPARLAQLAPGVAAQLLAAKLGGKFTGGSTAGKVIGAGGAGTLMSAGNEAQTAMDNQPGNAPGQAPNDAALTRGAGVAVGENAVGALPLSRFVGGGSGVITPGLAGALEAAKKFSVNAGFNAAGSGAADVVHQAGQSVGTPGGLNVNLPEVADATVSGGAMGGLLGAKAGARDLLNAKKFSAITPELMPAARQVANRAEDAAGGRNMDAGVIRTGGAQATGADVAHKVSSGIHAELADAVKGLSTPLSPDAQNIITSTKAGRMPTEADYNTLKSELANDPQAPSVLNLVQQAHALEIVKGTGNLSDNKFTGGLNASLNGLVTGKDAWKTGAVAGAAALGAGGVGHLITYSPEMMGGTIGLKALARLSDNITGAGSPMGRFTKGFADNGATPVRAPTPLPPAAPPQAPMGPTVPNVPINPGAVVAQNGGPWAQPKPQTLPPQVRQQMLMRSMPALRALAAQQGPNAPTALPAGFASMLSNPGGSQNLLAPPAAPAAAAADPVEVLKEMAMRAKVQKIRDARLAQAQAYHEVRTSPYIDQLVGGAENVPSPMAGAAMAKALSSAKSLAKLQSDPEAEALQEKADKAAAKAAAVPTKAPVVPAAPAPIPNVTNVTKANGKVSVGHDAGDYAIPYSPHADKAPDVAARAFLGDRKAAGLTTKSESGFLNGTTRNITNIRQAAQDVAARTPGISSKEIAGQFEGVQTRADAVVHRDFLVSKLPAAAGLLKHYFSNEAD